MSTYNKDKYLRDRLKKYGLTKEQYNDLLLKQGNHCKLCTRTEESQKYSFAIDTSLLTGEVKGLLCNYHNLGKNRQVRPNTPSWIKDYYKL